MKVYGNVDTKDVAAILLYAVKDTAHDCKRVCTEPDNLATAVSKEDLHDLFLKCRIIVHDVSDDTDATIYATATRFTPMADPDASVLEVTVDGDWTEFYSVGDV